jgi:hypothetical protein
MSNKSSNSLNSLKHFADKDTIPFRISFIKALLENGSLKPMLQVNDFENRVVQTENFISKAEDTEDSNDTRKLLDKQYLNFNKTIKQIGGKLLYIKSGSTGHTFKGTFNCDEEIYNYAVKVVAYPKKDYYSNLHDKKRPENAELLMIKLLSYFVVKKQTMHIVLPIATFNTSIEPFVKLVKDNIVDEENEKYLEFVKKYKKGEYHDDVSILISEWANKGDLLDYIRTKYKKFKLIHWKVFFFQVLSVLAVIQSKYPAFRHNDMKANNILIHKIGNKYKSFTYKVAKKEYLVPNIGYIIKLWDFDFACIPGLVENDKVLADWTKDINVLPEQNRYYDMHYFFNTLIKKGFFPQFHEEGCVPQEVKDFVDRIVPKKYRKEPYAHKRGRILIKDELFTPDDVLKNDIFFEEFRNPKKKVMKEIIKPITEKTEKKTILNSISDIDIKELENI